MNWIKEIRKELLSLDNSIESLRNFSLLIGCGLMIVSGLLFFRHHQAIAIVTQSLSMLVMLCGLLAPLSLTGIHQAWMTVSLAAGWLISRLILTLIFFLVVTPLGIIARFTGRDPLSLKRDLKASSYWIEKKDNPVNYDKMY
ncbi:MAG: SxtJ family membrane protein [Candidatus Wallbacteria bacterium]|nr:SxtJ family membrane protein [Candidatus Wallbacteria bacterium]